MSRAAGSQTNIEPVEEWEKVLLMAQLPEHWQEVYEVLWQTGIRISEALNLTKAELQNGGVIIVRRKRTDNRRDFIPLTSDLYEKIRARMEKQKNVHLFPYTAAAAWAALKLAAKKAGVRETVHPHSFRHGMGFRAMQRTNQNIAMVKEILGHKDIASTQRYINPPKYQVEETFRKLNRKPDINGRE